MTGKGEEETETEGEEKRKGDEVSSSLTNIKGIKEFSSR